MKPICHTFALCWVSVSVFAQSDVTPPTIESAASVGGKYIGIRFSERLQSAPAQNTANYFVTSRFGSVQVTAATLRNDSKSVVLALGGVITGTFTVRVNGVLDLAGLAIANNSTISGEVWALGTDVNGAPPGLITPPGSNFSYRSGDVDVQAGGTDIWGVNDEFHFVYTPRTGDFDVAVLVQRLDSTEFRAKAGLMARETLAGNSRSIQIDTNPLEDLGAAEYQAHQRMVTGGNVTSWGGEPGSDLPNAWMRLKRSGDIFTAYYGNDGINWNHLAGPLHRLMPAELLVGMETVSHDINTLTTAEYRNFGELRSGQVDPSIVGLLPLKNQTVHGGESVIWLAEVPGSSGYSFQWQKDGQNLLGATSAVYRIPTVAKSHAGIYSVMARNHYGAMESSSAQLIVNDPSTLLIPFTNVWRYEASGSDLGTAWKEPAFADGSWRTGPAPLGYETNTPVLPIPLGTTFPLNGRNITYYFRSQFTFTNEPADVYLRLRTLLDDGAVIHLNGMELARPLLGVGVVAFNTTAVDFVTDAVAIEQMDHLPSTHLIRGTNSIAVEVHQVDPPSTDIVFAMELIAFPLPPSALSITNQPQNVVVETGKAATLAVGVSGNRARYQWFKDGVPITGARDKTYSVTNATSADQGAYYVAVSNTVHSIQSREVMFTVIADSNPPRVTKAIGQQATVVEITFSEPVAPATATNVANYTITNMLGGLRTIGRAIMQGSSKVQLISQNRQPQQNYLLLVRNVKDLAAPPNPILVEQMLPIASSIQLISAETTWLYYDTVVDPPLVGTAWRQPGYDTTDWFSLASAFGYDFQPIPLPLPIRTVLSQGQLTTYFRKEFNFNGGMATTLRFNHYVDDGAVFYLNGVEVFRFNMPSGEITDQTTAAAVLGRPWPIETNIPVSLLRQGTNLVAVELHGERAADTDLFFALELNVDMDSFPGGPLLITAQPRSQTAMEGQPATFRVVGTGAKTLQWERDGQPITGANQATYIISDVDPTMNGASFSVVLSNATGGMLRSQSATLTVQAEDEPPRLLKASGQANYVTLKFSEPVEPASATRSLNYSLNNSGQTLPINNVVMGEKPTEVVLFTEELPQGRQLTVRVNGVTDLAATPNPVDSNTEALFTVPRFVPGFVKAEFYGADYFDQAWGETGFLYGHTLGQLKSHVTFPDAPQRAVLRRLWELDRSYDGADFFGARISGYFIPRESGPHVFYLCSREQGELWLSPDSYPGHKVLIAREPDGVPRRFWHGMVFAPDGMQYRTTTTNESGPIHLVAGNKYYMESLMKTGGESLLREYLGVAVKQPSEPNPPEIRSEPMQSALFGGYWELPDLPASVTIVRQPASQTLEEGQRIVLRVGVDPAPFPFSTGSAVVYYQWQRNGLDILGATSASYITPVLTAADNGVLYRVVMRTVHGDAVVSEPAIVSVVAPDTPVFLQISRRTDGNAVISWDRGGYFLQRSETLPGLWEAAATQVSPAVLAPAPEHREFFRLIKQ